jgi:hypothetical protein
LSPYLSNPTNIIRPYHRLTLLLFYDLLYTSPSFVSILIEGTDTIDPLLSDLYQKQPQSSSSHHQPHLNDTNSPLGGGFRMGTALSEFLGYNLHLYRLHPTMVTTLYSKISLLTLTVILENKHLAKLLFHEEFHVMPALIKLVKRFVSKVKKKLSFEIFQLQGNDTLPKCPLLIQTILESLTHLISNHLRKSISIDLYVTCLDVVQRIMRCGFQFSKRIEFDWASLWDSLMTLVRFLAANRTHLASHPGVSQLVSKVQLIVQCFFWTCTNFS